MNTPKSPLQEKLRGRPRRILSSAEKEEFNRIIQHEKEAKTETEKFYPGPQMAVGDSEQVQRIKKTLKEGEPDSKTKWDKARLEKEANVLKEWLQKNMVSRAQTLLRPSNNGSQSHDFRKSANQMASREMSAEFQKAAERYKYIMRELGREEEANLEEIRPS